MDNYKLNGFGKFSGGEYYDVTINGIGTLNGELNCNSLNVNGVFTSNNLIRVKNEISINGRVRFNENVKCSKLVLQGIMKCNENLEAEEVKIEGILTVEKEMNVGSIEISSARFSIRELHADIIKINDLHKIRTFNKMYEIGEIECTSIEADSLKCKKISAGNVKLGKNVEVELVEYSDTVDIDPRAKVGAVIKV